MLHRFSTDERYEAFREGLLGLDRQKLKAKVRGDGTNLTIAVERTRLLLAERNTTPLFGLGLIDAISDAEIQEAATQQAKEDPNVHGRFVGRFGWRGQTSTLGTFVRGACGAELGLQVSSDSQAISPFHDGNDLTLDRMDLTDQECEDLTTFVSRLPAPARSEPTDLREAALLNNGESLFKSVGCAACHRPKLGTVVNIYSDLLLHDMGEQLIDPSPAPRTAQVAGRARSYYEPENEPQEPPLLVLQRRREWKTPPLWGVRDSGPYLHDGRAANIEQAVAQHGGEAAPSAERFLALASADRSRVVGFLMTLTAPDFSKSPDLMSAASGGGWGGPRVNRHKSRLVKK